jgi:hypothetical protein
MNANDVRRLIAYASELWPQTFELPANAEKLQLRVGVWLEFLSDIPSEVGRAALAGAAEEPFPPAPGALRQRALRLMRRDLAPDADQAVAEIMTAVSRVGYMGSPEWSHPAIANTVEAFGGWLSICESTNPEALRAHLMKLYGSASTRHRAEETLAPAFAELLGSVLPELEAAGSIPQIEAGSALPSESPRPADRDDAAGLQAIDDIRATLETARAASRTPEKTDGKSGSGDPPRRVRRRPRSAGDDRGK